MSTGKSKARREEKRQLAKAYYDALIKVEASPDIKRIDTNSARKLSDKVGNDLSYSSKRLAMQADKIAKQINADDGYKKDVGAFNKRHGELQRQLKGETVQKFAVNNAGASNPFIANNTSRPQLYDTAEEAAATISNPAQKNFFGQYVANKPANYFNTNQGQNGPSQFVSPVSLGPIDGGYRKLADTEGAFGYLKALSEKAGASPVNQLATQYASIAEKLRLKLKRDTGSSNSGAGLLTSDLASAKPVQDVIA